MHWCLIFPFLTEDWTSNEYKNKHPYFPYNTYTVQTQLYEGRRQRWKSGCLTPCSTASDPTGKGAWSQSEPNPCRCHSAPWGAVKSWLKWLQRKIIIICLSMKQSYIIWIFKPKNTFHRNFFSIILHLKIKPVYIYINHTEEVYCNKVVLAKHTLDEYGHNFVIG